ncbi:DUF885 domain-containing protein [Sandaracinobacteroides saxicola]|uniref:DUF885 domain-containing protein n=1 Tax=Sandaracinobacteroides saxicola TaxID=2759707 RepID=A0A7G5IK97_9SPHN|nr:DUF885 domain-containing protein [Sandaracinobacteroides saxicola]QMW23789.1 DUF885 domain-containing protein [Sandaracinobacteroides saxicola]
MTAAERLAELAARYWSFECAEFPFAAIQASVATDAVAVFRDSAEDHARRDGAAGDFLAELDGIATAGLSPQERATHALLRQELENIRTEYAVSASLRPWLLPVGPDFNTIFFANSAVLGTLESAGLYVERLRAFPRFLADVQGNLRAGHAKGIRYPWAVLQAAAANTRGIARQAPAESGWYGAFKRATLRGDRFDALAVQALSVIETMIIPAMHAFADLIDGPLMAGARSNLSCIDAPDGRAYYDWSVRRFTTTAMTPEDIHALGLAEVARLETEVAALAADNGFAGDVSGYRKRIADDRSFIPESQDALRRSLESLCKRVDKRIPAFFGRIPRSTYGVDIVPEAVSAALPPAYAQPAPADGSGPGIFWANGILAKCPSYLYPALVVHEAWPGHLMHLAVLQELDHLPAFRRYGAVKYTAYIEGWALYCERLGVEMGIYQQPHEHYGRLEMEMWRACRLVVDTGIHLHDWSRDQAIAYMRERLALDDATIAGEVDRYAAFPGQALAYQIGNIRIRDLRARAEAALGDRFSIRDFHDAVLTAGAVPLDVLDMLVEDWLARETGRLAA